MTRSRVPKIRSTIISSVLGTALLGGCAAKGTEPHAMTAGQHQAAAATEDRIAAEHQGQNLQAAKPEWPQGPSPGTNSACSSSKNSNCLVRWSGEISPSDRHRQEAEQHRQLAEKHRAASQALRDAEERFCSGIPTADRDLSPFSHRVDIANVDALRTQPANDDYGSLVVQVQPFQESALTSGALLGARITFRAVPGMTSEWLQRVVDCHLARNAVVGPTEDMSFCPLAVPHATAAVSSTGRGFAVDVTSGRDDSAREIVKRVQQLVATGPALAK